MGEAKQETLVNFLKENIVVIAWTLYEMLAMDPNFINHHLNVDPPQAHHSPIVWKTSFSHTSYPSGKSDMDVTHPPPSFWFLATS